MKRYLKSPFKAVWRATGVVRRPIQHRIEAMLVRCCNRRPECHVSAETGLVMDHLLRELVRLQWQIDQLQQSVDDLSAPASSATGLSVVRRDRDDLVAAG